MAAGEITGEVQDCRSVKELVWKIPDFMSLSRKDEDFYESPEFHFEDSVWCLGIYPNDCDDYCKINSVCVGYVFLYLCRRRGCKASEVNVTFEIMKKNPSNEIKYIIKDSEDFYFSDDSEVTYFQMLKNSELLECKSTLLPSGILTIFCSVKTVDSDAVLERSSSTELTELDTLSQDLGRLFASGANSDVTLQVQKKEFRAHRSILSARSEVLASMFQHELAESKTGVVDIKDCDPDSFEVFLRYLYTGNTGDLTQEITLHLFKTADKYSVLKLRSFCVEFMKQHLSADTVCAVAAMAQLYEEELLFASAQAFFNKNAAEIFSAESWLKLMREDYRLANRLLKGMALERKIEDSAPQT